MSPSFAHTRADWSTTALIPQSLECAIFTSHGRNALDGVPGAVVELQYISPTLSSKQGGEMVHWPSLQRSPPTAF